MYYLIFRATNNLITGLPANTTNKMAYLRCFRQT